MSYRRIFDSSSSSVSYTSIFSKQEHIKRVSLFYHAIILRTLCRRVDIPNEHTRTRTRTPKYQELLRPTTLHTRINNNHGCRLRPPRRRKHRAPHRQVLHRRHRREKVCQRHRRQEQRSRAGLFSFFQRFRPPRLFQQHRRGRGAAIRRRRGDARARGDARNCGLLRRGEGRGHVVPLQQTGHGWDFRRFGALLWLNALARFFFFDLFFSCPTGRRTLFACLHMVPLINSRCLSLFCSAFAFFFRQQSRKMNKRKGHLSRGGGFQTANNELNSKNRPRQPQKKNSKYLPRTAK